MTVRTYSWLTKAALIGALAFATMAAAATPASADTGSKQKVIERFITYSHQDAWEATYIDAHEPGYGTGDQHIVNFPVYKSLANLRAKKKSLGTAFRESVLLSSGTVIADKDFWAVNGFTLFKGGRIDSTSLYSNTRGGPTPAGTKDYFTITGGTGQYFGARGTIIVERMGEGDSRYLKSTFKLIK